ncbi:MAG: 6-bladed beta-propeller [Coriobacteriia bacterium]|nr:6-bladed beta-propeller [Coriobacteriia bacterium]
MAPDEIRSDETVNEEVSPGDVAPSDDVVAFSEDAVPAETTMDDSVRSAVGQSRSADPHQLTSRERRRRWVLLAVLLLLLMLLSYLAYYFMMNRKMPDIGFQPAADAMVAPPQYLYSISAKDAQSLVRPVGVAISPDDRVYVVDFGHRRISVFSTPGKYLFSFNKTPKGTLMAPVHLAIKDNEVWVTDRYYDTIYIYDLAGTYLREFKPSKEKLEWSPLAITFDASGTLKATDVGNTKLHRLLYFSSDGSRTVTVGKTAQVNTPAEEPGAFLFPNGIAVAPGGEVFVSDGDNRRVQVFDASGAFLRFVNTSGVPRGVAIDPQKRLYVADALAHNITVFDLSGKTLVSFGERGFGPGQFNYPNDIAIDKRNRIYITDRENSQVQVWGWPVAQLPPVAPPKGPLQWLAALACCLPLILIPLLLLMRRKIRIVVTPDFVDALERLGEIRAVSERSRLRLIAPEQDRVLYEGRVVDGIKLDELITLEEHSESDARALMDKLRIAERPAVLLSMTWRAKALATEDGDLRLLALVAEVRVVDVEEFREMYLMRERRNMDATNT